MKSSKNNRKNNILFYKKPYNKSIEAFISEILAAERRILTKQHKTTERKAAINLYKESILIRELFTRITRHFDLALYLSKEQYEVAKRVWNKAFNTSLSATHNIQNQSICKRIDSKMEHAIMNIKMPC